MHPPQAAARSRARRARPVLLALGLVIALAGLAGSGAAGAANTQGFTGEQITQFSSAVTVTKSGTVEVTEKITYDFAGQQHHGIERTLPVRFSYDDQKQGYDRVTPLTVESVSADGGASAQYSTSTSGRNETIRIGDPDTTITGVRTYTIAYSLRGAINVFTDHDELYLNVTGDEWVVPIGAATATVTGPGRITRVTCFAGPTGSQLPCESGAIGDGGTAQFRQGQLRAGSGLTVVVGFPVGAIVPRPEPILEQRWTPAVGFAARPNTLIPAGGLMAAAVGGFAFLVRRKGADRRFAGSATDIAFGNVDGQSERAPLRTEEPVVEFVPPDGLRPGQVGTLIDEQANTLDVTATIIDLAVRGYLRITEIPKDGWMGSADWQLESLKPGTDLKPYENTLLSAIFAAGPVVKLSDLKNHFAANLKAVQNLLYEDMMANGWYRKRPDQTRTQVGCLAVLLIVVGIVITAALAKATSFGLVGIPLVVFGLLMVFGAKAFPSRTPKGYAALRRILGFKRFIDESEKERAQFAEKQNLFSEYLPYAVVFGATEKWAKAFAGIDGELPRTDWYVSSQAFNLIIFSQAMNGFTTATAGTISSVPASSGSSGFGGGGFSGGGFGGGGGGSW